MQLDTNWHATIYERDDIAASVEAWMATDKDYVDPFGGVAWPGAVVAARNLKEMDKSMFSNYLSVNRVFTVNSFSRFKRVSIYDSRVFLVNS